MTYQCRRSRFSFVLVPVLLLTLCAGFFGLVRLRSSFVSVEYRIGEFQMLKVSAQKEQKVLRAKLASLHSLGEIAQRGLALEFPDRQRVVYVKRDAGGVPRSASLIRE